MPQLSVASEMNNEAIQHFLRFSVRVSNVCVATTERYTDRLLDQDPTAGFGRASIRIDWYRNPPL